MNKIRARQNASYRFFHVIFLLRKFKRKITLFAIFTILFKSIKFEEI